MGVPLGTSIRSSLVTSVFAESLAFRPILAMVCVDIPSSQSPHGTYAKNMLFLWHMYQKTLNLAKS